MSYPGSLLRTLLKPLRPRSLLARIKHDWRSGWAALAAGALVASLFAVGAAPAAAIDEDSKPDALDAITGLNGDYDPGDITVAEGGTTVWAWTGENGDKVEDGGDGLAHVNLTETAPVTADAAKMTNDMGMGVVRAAFGSTVTVTIQLVDADGGDAGPPEGGASYRVVVRSQADNQNAASDDLADPENLTTGGSSVSTNMYQVDASGKVTFTVTAVDPDSNDDDDPDTGSVERVRVTYVVTQVSGPLADPADPGSGQAAVTGSTDTVMFSDGPSVPRGAAVAASADYLMAPTSGSASNVVTVTITDQYGKPMRNQMVRLSSTYAPTGDRTSEFPVARRTDSSGTVRIVYTLHGRGLRRDCRRTHRQ